jgi:hypothetical protein
MRTSQTWRVTLALVLAGFAGTLQNAEAHATESNLQFTIQVRTYGKIDPRTLAEAEKIAGEIFREAGVQSRWVDEKDAPQNQIDNSANNLDIRLHILPASMANRLGLPSNVMGVAPGTGPDRQHVYVFYNRAQELAHRQLETQPRGTISQHASVSQILGAMMAHEIGHVLLNMPLHSETGIMRGDWNLKDLYDVAHHYLFFTRSQAEIIRAEVARRSNQREAAQRSGR